MPNIWWMILCLLWFTFKLLFAKHVLPRNWFFRGAILLSPGSQSPQFYRFSEPAVLTLQINGLMCWIFFQETA
jgi:hypothetical protein